MPTVTVHEIVRPGAGYGTIAARFGVHPIEGGITRTSVTFPEPAPGDPPLDLAAVAEWLSSPNDAVMAQRKALRAALKALRDQPPPPPAPPSDKGRIAILETRVLLLEAVLQPLAALTLIPTEPAEETP